MVESNPTKEEKDSFDLFQGREAPALMSLKEPAIRKLKDRYSESFALTKGSKDPQVHLFMIRLGMWALVWTFTPRDTVTSDSREKFGITEALTIIESALDGNNQTMLQKLDTAVAKAEERIRSKLAGMHVSRK